MFFWTQFAQKRGHYGPRPRWKKKFLAEIKKHLLLSESFYFNKISYVLTELWIFFYLEWCFLSKKCHFQRKQLCDHQPAEFLATLGILLYYISWWQMFLNNSFYVSSHGAAINFLIWTSSPSFAFLLMTWISLFCHPLPLARLSGCFLWMHWMLVTRFNSCHVPRASRITTWRTRFTERLFSVTKEWVRSWSQVSLIIFHKTFTKTLKAVRPKSCRRGEKEKERQLQSVMH